MDIDDFEARTATFASWLKEMGIRTNPKMALVDLRSESRGRGVVATEDIEDDEIIFSIPRSAVLNAQNANPLPISRRLSEKMPAWLALTSILMTEGQVDNSKWAPYLAILPDRLDSLVFWSDSELAELQASAVVKKIGKKGAEALFTSYIAPLGLKHSSTEMCHKVASVIMAYAFDIPDPSDGPTSGGKGEDAGDDLVSDDGEDEKTILSMIPLADMLNADADRNNARLICDNEELEMRAIKPIPKGDEIFNDYGQLPRSDLLRRYGYVTDGYSAYDVAEISAELIVSLFRNGKVHPSLPKLTQDGLKTRLELAEREGVYEESFDLVHSSPDEPSIPDELLAFLYLLLVDESHLKAISDSESSLPSRSKLTTELAGQVLVILLQAREKEYLTTLEEDEELLKNANLPVRTAMAIQVRSGEKKVLRAAMQEATTFSGGNHRMRLAPSKEGTMKNAKRKGEEIEQPKKKGRSR
ncbi:Ribosomal lysine N-methyltransferase 4 [Ciborinia camelliae]|nr:Ribosomal lysine N-methyltransferase 4 [Ciborinia camelliae]